MTAEGYAGAWPFRLSEVEVVCARRTDGRREIGVRVTGGRIFGVNGLGRSRWGDADPILAPGRSRFELTPVIKTGETLC